MSLTRNSGVLRATVSGLGADIGGLPAPPVPVQERDSGKQIGGFFLRIDEEAPMPLGRPYMAHQSLLATDGACQMLPPVERSVEGPNVAGSGSQFMTLTHDRPDRQRPSRVATAAHDEAETGHESFAVNAAAVVVVRIEDLRAAAIGLQAQHEGSLVLVRDFLVTRSPSNGNDSGRVPIDLAVIPMWRAEVPFWRDSFAHSDFS